MPTFFYYVFKFAVLDSFRVLNCTLQLDEIVARIIYGVGGKPERNCYKSHSIYWRDFGGDLLGYQMVSGKTVKCREFCTFIFKNLVSDVHL